MLPPVLPFVLPATAGDLPPFPGVWGCRQVTPVRQHHVEAMTHAAPKTHSTSRADACRGRSPVRGASPAPQPPRSCEPVSCVPQTVPRHRTPVPEPIALAPLAAALAAGPTLVATTAAAPTSAPSALSSKATSSKAQVLSYIPPVQKAAATGPPLSYTPPVTKQAQPLPQPLSYTPPPLPQPVSYTPPVCGQAARSALASKTLPERQPVASSSSALGSQPLPSASGSQPLASALGSQQLASALGTQPLPSALGSQPLDFTAGGGCAAFREPLAHPPVHVIMPCAPCAPAAEKPRVAHSPEPMRDRLSWGKEEEAPSPQPLGGPLARSSWQSSLGLGLGNRTGSRGGSIVEGPPPDRMQVSSSEPTACLARATALQPARITSSSPQLHALSGIATAPVPGTSTPPLPLAADNGLSRPRAATPMGSEPLLGHSRINPPTSHPSQPSSGPTGCEAGPSSSSSVPFPGISSNPVPTPPRPFPPSGFSALINDAASATGTDWRPPAPITKTPAASTVQTAPDVKIAALPAPLPAGNGQGLPHLHHGEDHSTNWGSEALSTERAGPVDWTLPPRYPASTLAPAKALRPPLAAGFQPQLHSISGTATADTAHSGAFTPPPPSLPSPAKHDGDFKVGDTVFVDGRLGVVFWDGRPKHEYAMLRWKDDGSESGVKVSEIQTSPLMPSPSLAYSSMSQVDDSPKALGRPPDVSDWLTVSGGSFG